MKVHKTLSVLIVVLLALLTACRGGPTHTSDTGGTTASNEQQVKWELGDVDLAPPEPEVKAVSLRGLQAMLKGCQRSGSCPQALLQLGGLGRITGYVVDQANHDLILIGHVDRDLPPLYVEDLVIALRNTWLKYAPLKGNVYQYSAPGCSIDPSPQVLQRLQGLGQQIFGSSSSAGVEQRLQEWDRVCQQPQAVRVLGIPFETRFAHVMVTADYDMKRIVDGTDDPGLFAFTSLTGMTFDRIQSDVKAGKPVSIPLSSMNRFWFYPGENQYVEDEGIVWIKRSPVVLLTEEEYLNKRGEIVGSGRASSLAQQFAEKFSIRYIEVAKERPIYAELENLYRLVALAKIIEAKSAHTQAGLDLTYLLDEFPVQPFTVPKQLPGRSAVKKEEYRRDFSGGYELATFWLPSCGGVSMDIRADAERFRKDEIGVLSRIRRAVPLQSLSRRAIIRRHNNSALPFSPGNSTTSCVPPTQPVWRRADTRPGPKPTAERDGRG